MAANRCNKCEETQRAGDFANCLVCLKYNPNIYGKPVTTIYEEFDIDNKIEKLINGEYDKLRKLSINVRELNGIYDENYEPEDVAPVRIYSPTGDYRVTQKDFDELLEENKQRWIDEGVNLTDCFGIRLDDSNEYPNPEKAWWYITFPVKPNMKGYYIKKYGFKMDVIRAVEHEYRDEPYMIYSQSQWDTPNRYTKKKPSECYELWMR